MDKETRKEYDTLLEKEGSKIPRNNTSANINPYLRDEANAANQRIRDQLSVIRRQRQEAAGVGAGRGEVNPDSEGKKKGGTIRSASSRADGIATKGKTRGKMC
jgi:hypothetical protein